MNKNILIVLAGGFLIAILVAVLVQASLGGKNKKIEQATNKVEIIVAAKNLAMGKELAEGDLKWQLWPQDAVFAGAIVRQEKQTVAEAASGRMLQALSAGQPLHPNMISGAGKGNFLAVSLKEGMRAIAISVKAQTMAGGFVGPGDRVDVIVTYKIKVRDKDNPAVQSMIDQYATETVLENVRVLAADQKAIREEDKAKVARTVTLEVSAAEAEKLALAQEMGDLKLSLRGIGDDEQVRQENITTDVEMSRVLKDLAKVQGANGGNSGIVRVYNGQTVTNMPVRQIYND